MEEEPGSGNAEEGEQCRIRELKIENCLPTVALLAGRSRDEGWAEAGKLKIQSGEQEEDECAVENESKYSQLHPDLQVPVLRKQRTVTLAIERLHLLSSDEDAELTVRCRPRRVTPLLQEHARVTHRVARRARGAEASSERLLGNKGDRLKRPTEVVE